MTTVVPRPPRVYRSAQDPMPSPRDGQGREADPSFARPMGARQPEPAFDRPAPPYGVTSLALNDTPRGSLMPPLAGRRQLSTYRPMAEELKRYINALAGPVERYE